MKATEIVHADTILLTVVSVKPDTNKEYSVLMTDNEDMKHLYVKRNTEVRVQRYNDSKFAVKSDEV